MLPLILLAAIAPLASASADPGAAAARAFASFFTVAHPPAAFAAVMHRYECATLIGTRIDRVTVSGDDATVALTAGAAAELPLTRAPREFPPHWTLRLHRRGGQWRVSEVGVPEAAFAEMLVKISDPLQRLRALTEHGDLADGELVRRILDIAFEANRKGDYPRAAELGELALPIAETGAPAEVARAQWIIGRAHDSVGDEEGAAQPIAEAVRLAKLWNDRDVEARALVLRGWARLGDDPAGAVASFREGLPIADALGADQVLAEGYLGLGAWAMHRADDPVAALRYDDLAMEHARRAGDRVLQAAATANIGVVYDRMANYNLASAYLRRGIALYRQSGNMRGVVRNLRNLAAVEQFAKHFQTAARYEREVDALLVKVPDEHVAMLNNMTAAATLVSQHRPQEADVRCRKALQRAEAEHDALDIRMAESVLNSILFEQHRYAEAAAAAQALAERCATTTPDFEVYWKEKLLAGRALRKLGRLDEARKAFQDGIDAVERRHASMPGSGNDEQLFFSDNSSLYAAMFALAARRGDDAEALQWAERVRNRTLLEALAAGKVRSTRSLTPAEVEEERNADSRIGALNVALREARSQATPDRARIAALEQELGAARLEQESLTSHHFLYHPELSLARARVPPPSLAEIRRSIPPDGVVLEYVADSDDSWVIALTRDGRPRIARIHVSLDDLEARVKTLARLFSTADVDYRPSARRMYDLVVAPAAAAMRGKTIVCVIPDGPLWDVPFQALVDPEGRHVLERRALFYAPSLTLLSWYERHPRPQRPQTATLLAVGNPRLTNATTQMAQAVSRDESLAPLPDAEREAKRIAAFFPPGTAFVLVGAKATEARVKREAGRYRILHFATHGVFNDTTPMYSHIALARAPGDADDGLLEAREIAALDLDAELAVLSSCETARGGIRLGQGLVGMSWAFLAAGCPRAVVTQWPIASASAGDLMIDFYRRLTAEHTLTGRAATESLRRAQLAMLAGKNRRHPFHWAGFVLMGRGW